MFTSTHENSRTNFTFYPLLWIAICFSLGIFVGSKTSLDWSVSLVVTVTLGIFSVVLHKNRFSQYLLLMAFVAAGSFYIEAHRVSEPTNLIRKLVESGKIVSGDPVEIEGRILGKPELSVGGFYLRMASEEISYKGHTFAVTGNVRLFAPVRDHQIQVEYDGLNLTNGVRIRVACKLIREQKYLNPGGVSVTDILDQKDIDATSQIESPLLIETISNEPAPSVISWVYDYRERLILSIRSKFSVSTSGILIASLLGNRAHLAKETAEVFRNGGTFHVLVISGLHITFIGGILLVLVRSFTRNRFLQFAFVSSILWLYAFAVGTEIPIVRAAMMLTILLFSFVVYRNNSLLNALGACSLLILFWRPNDLFSQSFQLTFVSLFGILGFAFPLIEKLRAIGLWTPSAERPFPPGVHPKLKTFCELLYWSESKWKKKLDENIWDCGLFKSRYAQFIERRGIQRPLRWLFEGVFVTTIVQIFLLPLLILYFHRVSYGSIVLNLWVGVFLFFQNLTALAGIVLGCLSEFLALPLIRLAELFNWFLLAIPRLFIEYDLASARVPIYSKGIGATLYLAYFITVIVLCYLLNRWNPFEYRGVNKSAKWKAPLLKNANLSVFLIFLVLLGLIIFHPYSDPLPTGKLQVDFLDVGQGDSAFVTFPNGETMLIDGGGSHKFRDDFVKRENGELMPFQRDSRDVGETVVSEFLWEKGYSKVDYILATHADADHIQGLTTVAKNFNVKVAIVGKTKQVGENFDGFSATLKSSGVPLVGLSNGDQFNIGGARILVFSPDRSEGTRKESSNNKSLVFGIRFKSKSFLFTGDIEREVEGKLLDDERISKVDIVKVAHHGSNTSSIQKFVEVVQAQYAIIPVGKKSRFGHPHSEVVKRWKLFGARVLTTGEKGTITVSTDGRNLEVQTYIK